MEPIEIPEEKKWAKGMDQAMFECEFLRRNPRADSVPQVDEWIGRPVTTYHGINPPLTSDMEVNDETAWKADKLKDEKRKNAEKEHVCRGCGRTFGVGPKKRIGWIAHERKCKLMQNKKI